MYVYMYVRDPILGPIIGDRLVKPEDLLFYVIVSTRRSEQLHTHTHTHTLDRVIRECFIRFIRFILYCEDDSIDWLRKRLRK